MGMGLQRELARWEGYGIRYIGCLDGTCAHRRVLFVSFASVAVVFCWSQPWVYPSPADGLMLKSIQARLITLLARLMIKKLVHHFKKLVHWHRHHRLPFHMRETELVADCFQTRESASDIEL